MEAILAEGGLLRDASFADWAPPSLRLLAVRERYGTYVRGREGFTHSLCMPSQALPSFTLLQPQRSAAGDKVGALLSPAILSRLDCLIVYKHKEEGDAKEEATVKGRINVRLLPPPNVLSTLVAQELEPGLELREDGSRAHPRRRFVWTRPGFQRAFPPAHFGHGRFETCEEICWQ